MFLLTSLSPYAPVIIDIWTMPAKAIRGIAAIASRPAQQLTKPRKKTELKHVEKKNRTKKKVGRWENGTKTNKTKPATRKKTKVNNYKKKKKEQKLENVKRKRNNVMRKKEKRKKREMDVNH